MSITRRQALFGGLFGAGYLGLRALATGVPAAILAHPLGQTAKALAAEPANDTAQYLVFSTSRAGDPFNSNCPGTYAHSDIVHPNDARMAEVSVGLGGTAYGAAAPWAAIGWTTSRAPAPRSSPAPTAAA